MKKIMNTSFAWLLLVVSLLQLPALNAGAVMAPAGNPNAGYAAPGGRDIIKEIIDVVGLKPRFEVREADVDNAAAVIYNGQRYILYDRQFLAAINNAVKTDWGAVSILAHEIGHHLNGHTLSRGGSNPADELEADEFSGFVLRKMGASLADAQAAISFLSEERGSHTHPGRSARLASISKGWNSAEEQIIAAAKVKPSNRPQPAIRPERATVAAANQTPARTVNQRVALNQQSILRKVNFRGLPHEEIYVTNRMNLVRINESGQPEVIGKMARTNSRSYPFVLQSDYFDALLIGTDGSVLNQNGQRIGYLS